MKEIILMRHGKSSWDYLVEDRDRPLLPRGISDAKLVAAELQKIAKPDAIFSSPANRALHTCTLVMRSCRYSWDALRIDESLYDFEGAEVASFVRRLNNDLNKIILFGHNYAFTKLANIWGNVPVDHLPTAGAVQINFDVEHWQDLNKGKTIRTMFPKNLR